MFVEAQLAKGSQRLFSLVALFALGGGCLLLGDRWTIKFIPAHYVGFLFIGAGCLGLLGVNIWKGGPLDKNLDNS